MDEREIERLKWRSRRGLLELDLVFARFFAGEIGRLDEAGFGALDLLLKLPDNDLLDMVMGRKPCEDARLAPIVQMLRAA
jgi:succinate dehydrogenase flavin-adding protein (antitoxin of CptAB toxin-antitoxin module)